MENLKHKQERKLEDEFSFAHCSILIIFNNPNILLIFVCLFHLSHSLSLSLSLTHTYIYFFSELFKNISQDAVMENAPWMQWGEGKGGTN